MQVYVVNIQESLSLVENGWKLFVGWVVCFWLKAFAKKIPPKKGEIKIRFQGGERERERAAFLHFTTFFLHSAPPLMTVAVDENNDK